MNLHSMLRRFRCKCEYAQSLPEAVYDIIALVASGAHPALTKNAVPQFKRLSAKCFLSPKLSLDYAGS